MEKIIDNSKLPSQSCFVCHEYMGPFRNELATTLTTFSERSLLSIFETFADFKLSNDVSMNSGVCQNCFIKFNDIDEYQTNARRIEDEILALYHSSYDVQDVKHAVKVEDEDFSIVEVMFDSVNYSGDSESHDSETNPFMQSKSQRNRRPPKRSYTKKKDLDEGLTVIEVDGAKIYQCDICKKTCRDRYRLKSHREIHKTERNVCCNECGSMFKTLTCLYSHKKIHKERVYHQCDHCEMRYIQKTQLRKHMEAIHLKRKDHICAICGKCYSRDTTLSKHMFVHKDEKDVICTVCGFRTHTKPKMERHMKSHTGERNYACNICGKRFLYSYNVTAHIKHVHNREKRKIDEEKLTCKLCGKRFQKIWKVKQHIADEHQLAEDDDQKNSLTMQLGTISG